MTRLKLSPKSTNALIALGVFAVALVLLVLVSRLTPQGGQEQRFLAAAKALGNWLDEYTTQGSAIFLQPARDQVFRPIQAQVQLPAFVSGWFWQVTAHRHAWVSSTVALRSGFLLVHAIGVSMLYLLVLQAWGRRAALLSCVLFLLIPRSMHLLVMATGEGVVLTSWLLIAATYLRSLRGGSIGWTVFAGAALGLGLALSTAALWCVVLILLHTLWARRRELKEAAREGTITFPSALLTGIMIAPVVFLLCTPWLWHETGARMRQLFTTSLAPSIMPTVYGGALVSGPPLPGSFALRSAVLSLPTITLVLAGAGAAVLVRRWWDGRREARVSQDGALGVLLLIGSVFVLVWPVISPDVLAVYPPRWILVMPWAAAAAGLGLDVCIAFASEALGARPLWQQRLVLGAGVLLVLGVPLIQTVRGPSTLGAAFSPLAGGPAGMFKSRTLPLHDASMVARIAPAIDEQGRSNLSLWAPDLPAEVWESLRSSGEMKTVVRAAPNARDADYVVVSGGAAGDAVIRALWTRNSTPPSLLGVVERDGAILLALYRVK